MKKLIAGATVLAFMLMGSAAFAKDHDRDDHKGKRHERVEGRWDRDRDRGGHYRDARLDKDHDRDHDRRPPGWDKGKKKGWGDCDVPPGQAKKQGCYDRDRRPHHHARRVVRRTPPTTTTVRRDPRPVEGVWRQNKRTSTSPRPTTTQQTTTTTTTTPAPTASNGTWRK